MAGDGCVTSPFRVQTYDRSAQLVTKGRDLLQTIQRYYRNAFTGEGGGAGRVRSVVLGRGKNKIIK